MKNSIQRAAVATFGATCALLAAWVAHAQGGNPQTVTTTVNEQQSANKAAAASQNRINQLDDETQRLLTDYRDTLRETESLRRYNEQMELQIKAQEEEMASITQQIAEIERTNREIYPLMQRMVETLDKFIALDLPFLKEERAKRIATLKETLVRADVSTAEKYRRVLEAYTIEMEYGRTIEAYEGPLGEGEESRTVNFVRLGRSALLYQTLDASESGYWNADEKKFVEDNGYDDDVTHALRVARKQTAPDLIVAPIRAPEVAAQETK